MDDEREEGERREWMEYKRGKRRLQGSVMYRNMLINDITDGCTHVGNDWWDCCPIAQSLPVEPLEPSTCDMGTRGVGWGEVTQWGGVR